MYPFQWIVFHSNTSVKFFAFFLIHSHSVTLVIFYSHRRRKNNLFIEKVQIWIRTFLVRSIRCLIFLFFWTTTTRTIKIRFFFLSHTITLNRIVQQRNFCSIVYWKRHHRTQNDVHTLNLLSLCVYDNDDVITMIFSSPSSGHMHVWKQSCKRRAHLCIIVWRYDEVWTRVCVTFACSMYIQCIIISNGTYFVADICLWMWIVNICDVKYLTGWSYLIDIMFKCRQNVLMNVTNWWRQNLYTLNIILDLFWYRWFR